MHRLFSNYIQDMLWLIFSSYICYTSQVLLIHEVRKIQFNDKEKQLFKTTSYIYKENIAQTFLQ